MSRPGFAVSTHSTVQFYSSLTITSTDYVLTPTHDLRSQTKQSARLNKLRKACCSLHGSESTRQGLI